MRTLVRCIQALATAIALSLVLATAPVATNIAHATDMFPNYDWELMPCLQVLELAGELLQASQEIEAAAESAEASGRNDLANYLHALADEAHDEGMEGYWHYLRGDCK